MSRIGRRVELLQTDVSDAAACSAAVKEAAARFSRLDVLVNAAGMNIRQPAVTFTPADFDRLMAVNLKGAFFAVRPRPRSSAPVAAARS